MAAKKTTATQKVKKTISGGLSKARKAGVRLLHSVESMAMEVKPRRRARVKARRTTSPPKLRLVKNARIKHAA